MDDEHTTTGERPGPHQRAAALRDLALHPCPDHPPWPELEVAHAVFGSERDLLLAAHHRWQTHLLARLDAVVEDAGADVHQGITSAVVQLGREQPGLVTLLHRSAEHPALRPAQVRLAGLVDQACACGEPHPTLPRTPTAQGRRCLVGRRRQDPGRWSSPRRRLSPGIHRLRRSTP